MEAEQLGFRLFPVRLEGAWFPLGLLGLRKAIETFRPDLVCAHRSEDQTAVALLDARVPLVRIRSDIRRPVRSALAEWVDRRTDLVVVANPFMLREGYLRHRNGPACCMPMPVDTERFRPSVARPPGTLLSVGRLSEVKGHRTLIRALAELPGVRAVIAGQPAQQDVHALEGFAALLGVSDRLEFVGRVSDMPAFYSLGTLGTVASLGSEAVSRAASEMMACGVPVLAAATNGLQDQISDGRTGLFHPPGDWETLAAQARHLLDNPSVAARLSENGRDFCERELSIPAAGRRWEAMLLSLGIGNNAGSIRVFHSDGADNPRERWICSLLS
jgi:glycosyltransferase involved in cell wall biosynthesis